MDDAQNLSNEFGILVAPVDETLHAFGEGADPSAPPAAAPADAPPSTTEAAPSPEAIAEFKFAGRSFKSQTEAEQRLRALENRARTKDGIVKARDTRIAELTALVETMRFTASPVAPTGPSTPEPTEAVGAMDWGKFKELADTYGVEYAQAYYDEQAQARLDAALNARLGDFERDLTAKVGPLEEHYALQSRVQKAATLVDALRGYTRPNGQPAYPELNSEEGIAQVSATLKNLGLSEELALTPAGIHIAIAVLRDLKSDQARGLAAPSVPPFAAPNVPTADSGRTVTPRRPTQEEAIIASFTDGRRVINEDLGLFS